MKNNNKSKIILITDSYYPLNDATSVLNETISNFLSSNREITVLVTKSIFGKERFISNPKKNLYIRRVPLPFFSSKYIPFKIFKFAFYCSMVTIYLVLKKSKNNLYIIHSSPPLLIPYFTLLSKLKKFFFNKKTSLILMAHDLYPNILLHFKGFSSSKIIYGVLKKIYLFSYLEYEGIISCCDSIKDLLIKEYGIRNSKIITIPCWSLIPNNILMKFKKPKIILGKKIYPKLVLMGNIGVLHLVENLQEVISLLTNNKKLYPRIELYIRGSKSNWLSSNLPKSNLISVNKIVDRKELIKVYSEPTVSFVSLEKSASFCAFPSRISTSLSLGAPILLLTDCLINNPLVDFIEKHDVGIAIDNNYNKQQIISTYEEFLDNYNSYSENAKNCYYEFFNESKCLKMINDFLEKTF